MFERVENQATVDSRVLFKFKPIGLKHEGGEHRIHQAKAEIGLVVKKNETRRFYLSYEAEERRRFCQKAPALFDSLVSNIICYF